MMYVKTYDVKSQKEFSQLHTAFICTFIMISNSKEVSLKSSIIKVRMKRHLLLHSDKLIFVILLSPYNCVSIYRKWPLDVINLFFNTL